MSRTTFALLASLLGAACATRPRAAAVEIPAPARALIDETVGPPTNVRAPDGSQHAKEPAPVRAVEDSSRATAIPVAEITRAAAADSAVAAVIAVASPAAAVLPMLSLDQYASHDRVDYYLKLFSGNAREHVEQRMSEGTRYGAFIRDKLRAAGIPEDIQYLAFIESGFDPHAFSSAAAVGMWQFMTSSARDFGLRVDWWIDERRDPMRATDAAIKYLRELNEQFGSYYLAAAAYNGGAGRVSRGLARLTAGKDSSEPDDKFFALASANLLRTETRNFVPQLIAAALIGRDPQAYGIHIDTQPAFAFDSVLVPPATGLAGVAKACSATTSEVRDLNGQVLRGMTPVDAAPVWLRVPPGCARGFAEAFVALDSTDRAGATNHAVKKGETPGGIAKKAGFSLATFRRYNPKLVKAPAASPLDAGRLVLIPTRETIDAAREVPDPAIERYGVAVGGVYEVRAGDTLGRIAERNHTSVATIQRLNGIKGSVIRVGQKLRVK